MSTEIIHYIVHTLFIAATLACQDEYYMLLHIMLLKSLTLLLIVQLQIAIYSCLHFTNKYDMNKIS